MTLFRIRSLVFVVLFLGSVAAAQVQEMSVAGTITDSTRAVLGVGSMHGAADHFRIGDRWTRAYRLGIRLGEYRIVAALQGFRSLERQGVALLVGQEVTVNLDMKPGDFHHRDLL